MVSNEKIMEMLVTVATLTSMFVFIEAEPTTHKTLPTIIETHTSTMKAGENHHKNEEQELDHSVYSDDDESTESTNIDHHHQTSKGNANRDHNQQNYGHTGGSNKHHQGGQHTTHSNTPNNSNEHIVFTPRCGPGLLSQPHTSGDHKGHDSNNHQTQSIQTLNNNHRRTSSHINSNHQQSSKESSSEEQTEHSSGDEDADHELVPILAPKLKKMGKLRVKPLSDEHVHESEREKEKHHISHATHVTTVYNQAGHVQSKVEYNAMYYNGKLYHQNTLKTDFKNGMPLQTKVSKQNYKHNAPQFPLPKELALHESH